MQTTEFFLLWSLVSRLEFQHSQQLQIKSELIQQGNSQVGEQSLEADHSQDSAFNIVCVDSFIWDISEPARDSLAENGSSSKTEEWKKNHTPCSCLTVLSSKRKRHVQRSLPPMRFNMKKLKLLSASQNPTGPHCCKACGKIFHYMYTLRTRAQTHTEDKICICGKHLQSTESLVHHLQSHTKRNKCGICGMQFLNFSRLKRHRRFHRPKDPTVTSSA